MDGANGSVNGSWAMNGMNGSVKPSFKARNEQPTRQRTSPPPGSGILSRSFAVFARLLTWYAILTILFRCPATIEKCDETTPKICKPYFQVKQVVSPHLQPYYDAYAAPYVEIVRPYYDVVDRTVVAPGWGYATKYGAPRVAQAQAHSRAVWEKNVQPQLQRYQGLAKDQYDQSLAPYVSRVTSTMAPYYDLAKTNAMQTYYEFLLPSYEYVRPYALQGYRATSGFVMGQVVPTAAWTWNKTYIFLDGTVWPQIRAAYLENVEPQLVKISQRLGRHKDKVSTLKSAVGSGSGSSSKATSSFAKPTSSVATTDSAPSSTPATSTSNSVAPDSAAAGRASDTTEAVRLKSTADDHVQAPKLEKEEEKNELIRKARQVVAEDLRDWQERYAKAADEGAAEMEERVEEIAKRLIRRNAKAVGKPLLEQLQTTIVQELITLRRDILNIVGAVVKGSATREDGREQLNVVVRRAGMSIKEAAQKVRSWREKYEAELQGSITKAAEEHFKILDEIRDLAIQKIGMKWAWMDGITYKDWAKYHQLKSRFDEWHDDLQKLIVTHPTLEAAQLEGANIEDEAMNVAQTAAKELARLKQVGNWKLIAGDTSDEFDSDLTREAAEKAEAERAAAERAAEAAQAAEESESPGDPETVSSDHAQEHTEPAAEAVTEAASVLEPTEEDEALVSSATSDDTPPIASTEEAGAADGISTSSEVASSPADPDGASHTGSPDLAADATNAILNDPPVVVSNATDSNPSENVVPPVALPVEGSPHLEEEPVVAEALDEEPPAAATTTTVRSAMFGAAAQSVPSRQPILDDDALENVASVVESIRSNIPASFSSAAQSAYSDAVSRANQQYSQALSAVSVQIHGTPQPVHERVLASVTSAYSNALETASSRFDEALRLAQQQFGGTPSSTTKMLPTAIPVPSVPSVEWSRVESIASERLSQGRAWAAEQYERATSSLKELAPTASPSPSPGVLERGLSDAQHHYYAALGLAHARYSDFLEAASSALSSVTATPTPTDLAGTVSSVASVASESAASVGEAIADSWEVTVSKVSEVVYGAPTPTPWYEKVCQSGTELASAAASVAGSQAASVTSAAAAYASSGSEEAAKRYSSVSSLVSELLVGKEPTVSESVYSRLSAAYSHGVASVTSLAGEAQSTASSALGDAASVAKSAGEKVASAASGATEAVKSSVEHAKDEL